MATQSGRIGLGIESVYNVGAGIAGKDVTQTDTKGDAREMQLLERGLRVAGGLLGANQVIKTEVALPNSLTNKAVNKLDDIFKNNTPKPQSELITPEGFRFRVDTKEVPDNVQLSKGKTQEADSLGRRDLDSHEGVSGIKEGKQVGHAVLKHVGKSENWLQNRIIKEGVKEASSFHNETVGNRTVGRFVKENKDAVAMWLKSNSNDNFKGIVDMEEDIGLIVRANKKGTPLPAEKATKAMIILVKDNSEHGWHLFTVMLQK